MQYLTQVVHFCKSHRLAHQPAVQTCVGRKIMRRSGVCRVILHYLLAQKGRLATVSREIAPAMDNWRECRKSARGLVALDEVLQQ